MWKDLTCETDVPHLPWLFVRKTFGKTFSGLLYIDYVEVYDTVNNGLCAELFTVFFIQHC